MPAMTAANLAGSPGQRRQSQDGRAPESEDDWPMRQVDGERTAFQDCTIDRAPRNERSDSFCMIAMVRMVRSVATENKKYTNGRRPVADEVDGRGRN